MDRAERRRRSVLVASLLLAAGAAGCRGPGRAETASATPAAAVARDTGGAAAPAGVADVMEVGPGAAAARGPRTPQDSALQTMAAGLLPQLETMSGLKARRPIRFARRTKAQLQAYLAAQLQREMPPPALRGVSELYDALGLMPDTLNLRRLLLALYTEQVIGFYDPRSKILYVMDDVPSGSLRTILAHEMVHALQDQHVNLDSIVSPWRGNDRQLAAQAAVEGQATLIMFREALAHTEGHSVAASALPDMAAEIEAGLKGNEARFPVFRSAPAIIRESMVYPYAAGAHFVQALWKRHPDAAPLDSLMPQSTEQVSFPNTKFFGTRDRPTQIYIDGAPRDVARDSAAASESGIPRWGWSLDGWHVDYCNTMGEDELGVVLQAHLGTDARQYARGWDGDRFLVLSRGDVHGVVLWYLVWDNAASARAFAGAYRRTLARRPGRVGSVEQLQVQGRAVVRVVDAPRGTRLATLPKPGLSLRQGHG